MRPRTGGTEYRRSEVMTYRGPRYGVPRAEVCLWPRPSALGPRASGPQALAQYSVDRELIASARLGSASSVLLWPYGPLEGGYPWLIVWIIIETSRRRVGDEVERLTETD